MEQTLTYAVEVGGRFYLIENVPARVCVETGEALFSPETVERIQRIRRKKDMKKRNFSNLALNDVMPLISADLFIGWQIEAPARPPSDTLVTNLQRLRSFDTLGSEAAKLLLVDTLLTEKGSDYF